MLTKYVPVIFKRQTEQFPQAIAALDSIAHQRDMTRSGVIRLTQEIAHDLRNQLTVVSTVLEFSDFEGG